MASKMTSLEGWDMLYNKHFMLHHDHLCYITKQCSIYNMLYTMLMRSLNNNKTSYLYKLQLISLNITRYILEKRTCYVTKVVYNM